MASPGKNIFLILGSNLGDREGMLKQAIGMIRQEIGAIGQLSSVYESDPWGHAEGGPFLNQVIRITSETEPHGLLKKLLEIEKRLGRERPVHLCPSDYPRSYLSRSIDIDILFYGNDIIDTGDLRIPHPDIAVRRFVLVPLAEIAHDLVHPLMKKSILELLEICMDNSKVIEFTPDSTENP